MIGFLVLSSHHLYSSYINNSTLFSTLRSWRHRALRRPHVILNESQGPATHLLRVASRCGPRDFKKNSFAHGLVRRLSPSERAQLRPRPRRGRDVGLPVMRSDVGEPVAQVGELTTKMPGHLG